MIYIEQSSNKYQQHINKIEYYVDDNNCWICSSHAKDKDGYPKMRRNNKDWRISRYIYTLEHGEITKGLYVMHTCDNPNCINPSHMLLGTAKDNNRDRERKGRSNKCRDSKGIYSSGK